MTFRTAFLAVAICAITSGAQASCPRLTAPYAFKNSPGHWGKDDSGPIVEGFVDSRRTRGGVLEAYHGIDVSAGNNSDYQKVIDCGGTFAIVRINHSIDKKHPIARIDEQFLPHVRGFDKSNIVSFPYYYLSVPKPMKTLKGLLSREQINDLKPSYAEYGRKEAERFLGFVSQLSNENKIEIVRPINIAGLSGRFGNVPPAVEIRRQASIASGR
jgi:hypothetical protein